MDLEKKQAASLELTQYPYFPNDSRPTAEPHETEYIEESICSDANAIFSPVIDEAAFQSSFDEAYLSLNSSDDPASPAIVGEDVSHREIFRKDFLLDNGIKETVLYPSAVHFKDGDIFEEIDNTLKSDKKDDIPGYQNARSAWSVFLPETIDSQTSVSLSQKDNDVRMCFCGVLSDKQIISINPSRGTIEKTIPDPESLPPERKILSKIWTAITYKDILKKTSLRYDLISHKLKESIIMESYPDFAEGYVFKLNTTSLQPVLLSDGSVFLYHDEAETSSDAVTLKEDAHLSADASPVFVLPPPALVDSSNTVSRDIKVCLEKEKEDTWLLTYYLPKSWLSSSERVYPVTLDPTIEIAVDGTGIQDRTVGSVQDYDYTDGILGVGKSADYGIERSFVKWIQLPSLTSADVVVSAAVEFLKPDTSTGMVIEVHKVEAEWDSESITWQNQPGHKSKIEEYAYVDANNWYNFDITDIAQDWYRTGLNTGFMLKAPDSIESGSPYRMQLYSSDYSPANAPVMQIRYLNNCGLEAVWDYTQNTLTRAGNGYVNDYTGNLVWVHNGLTFKDAILPVTIQHVYNANDKDSNPFGLGYGWRCNYHQKIYAFDETSAPAYYIWEDEDGTRHYLGRCEDGSYEDENGSGLKLTCTGSGDRKYCLTDKKENKRYFDEGGRLRCLCNQQADVSSISITYASSDPASGYYRRIDRISDSSGRYYRFHYNSGEYLTDITYTGTGADPVSSHSYTYDGNGNLTSIIYPDQEAVSFAFDTKHLLLSAEDPDEEKICYTYSNSQSTSTFSPYRVTKIQSYSEGALSGTLNLEYAHNQTVLTDHNGNKQILQFNSWGSTVSVQDTEGKGRFFQYTGESGRKTGSQLILSSKLQHTVINKTLNGSFEEIGYWGSLSINPTTGSWGYASNEAYHGSRSLKITRTAEDTIYRICSAAGNRYSLQPGKSYSISAYVKTSAMSGNGYGARIALAKVGSTAGLCYSEAIRDNTDWTRLTAYYTHPTDAASIEALIYLENGTIGTAYFDAVQFEEGASASRYNLIQNSDFTYTDPSTSEPLKWVRGSACVAGDGRQTLSSSAAPCMDSYVLGLKGEHGAGKVYYQAVAEHGNAGDVFVLSGWAKGDSVPLKTGRAFGMLLRFYNSDGTTTDKTFSFNPDSDSSDNWQYLTGQAVSVKAYNGLVVMLVCSNNQNTVYFDGIQLFKERLGHSYSYNDKGEVVSATDLNAKQTTYEYTNNNLTRITLPDGLGASYTYDSYHNVTRAENTAGLRAEFTYDTKGNNTGVTLTDGTSCISSSASYTAGGSVSSLTDPLGNTAAYGYDSLGNLSWSRMPGLNDLQRINYSYDSLQRVSEISQGNASIQYGYTKDLLTSLSSPSGSEYHFTHGVLNQLQRVTIGEHPLLRNTYTSDQNRQLQSTVHSNANQISYGYDSLRRLSSYHWNNGDTVVTRYGSDGNAAIIEDGISGREIHYTYDFLGQIERQEEKGDGYQHSISWKYDSYGRKTGMLEKLSSGVYNTGWYYDDQRRILNIGHNVEQSIYLYDSLSRLEKLIQRRGSANVISNEIGYQAGSGTNQTSTWIRTWTNKSYNAMGDGSETSNVSYTYSYDARGNITQIQKGPSLISYVYDSKNQLIRENNSSAGKTWTYSYDEGGNILAKIEYAYTTGNLGPYLDAKVYSYTNTDWKDLLTGYDGNTLTYDGTGNLLSDGTWSYSWDRGRELTGMNKTGTSISYDYNAEGYRIRKTVNGTVTSYDYAGGKLSHLTKGNDSLHFDYDTLGPCSVYYNGSTYYYQRNAQGDITGIVNAYGQTVVSYLYDAWGKVLSQSGSMSGTLGMLNPFRYRGYIYDLETGLYYLISRYYNPGSLRMISSDCLISAEKDLFCCNQFVYCLNNPVNEVDVTGHNAISIVTDWAVTMWWLNFVDGLLPVGDIIYWGGLALISICTIQLTESSEYIDDISYSKSSNSIPNYNDNNISSFGEVPTPTPNPNHPRKDRKTNVNKNQSLPWKNFNNVRNSKLKTDGRGASQRFYDWDYTHNDIEVYNSRGEHLGSMDPITGQIYKPPVSGRYIKIP